MIDDLDSWPCGLVRIAEDGRILAINRNLLDTLGYRIEDVRQRSVDLLLPAGSKLFFHARLLPSLQMNGAATEVFVPLQTVTGESVPMLANVVRHESAAGHHYDCAFFLTAARADYEARLVRAKKAAERARSRNAALVARVAAMREELRQSVAHTLHENLAQEISGLKWALESLSAELAGADRSLSDRLGELAVVAGATLGKARGLSYELHPPELKHLGFRAAVQRHAEVVAAANAITVEIFGGARLPRFGEVPQLVLFRAVEEALSNVVRHARAKRVTVDISHDSDAVTVVIQDDGVGMDQEVATSPRSLGIAEIAERLASVGGGLAVLSTPGHGCRLEARVPRERTGSVHKASRAAGP